MTDKNLSRRPLPCDSNPIWRDARRQYLRLATSRISAIRLDTNALSTPVHHHEREVGPQISLKNVSDNPLARPFRHELSLRVGDDRFQIAQQLPGGVDSSIRVLDCWSKAERAKIASLSRSTVYCLYKRE